MEKKWNGMENITAEIVATTSLPVDRLTATDCNAAARANILAKKGHLYRIKRASVSYIGEIRNIVGIQRLYQSCQPCQSCHSCKSSNSSK